MRNLQQGYAQSLGEVGRLQQFKGMLPYLKDQMQNERLINDMRYKQFTDKSKPEPDLRCEVAHLTF